MKTLIKFGFLALLAAATASCTTEKQQDLPGTTTLVSLEAVVAEMPQTKAVLTDDSKIKWELGDQLLVFSDTDDPVSFENKTGEGNTFSSSTPLNGSEFYACFPAWAYIHPDDNKTVEFFLDTFTQVFTGKNPSVVSPMVAKSNGKSFQFRQTAGLLHFAITGTGELVSVSLSGNDGEPLTGNARLSFNDAIPVLQFPEEGCGRVASFTPDTPVKLSKEEAYDIYFILPPMTFAKGFTLELNFGDESISKSSGKAVTIKRAIITNYSLDSDSLKEQDEDALTLERNALIAFYNAMNGPNWTNNTNWCSDRPVSEWNGINFGPGFNWSEEKKVKGIYLLNNNLSGTLPPEMADLTELTYLQIKEESGNLINYEQVSSITSLETLIMGIGDFFLPDTDEYYAHYISIPGNIGNLQNLSFLEISGVKGTIPESLFNLSGLQTLELRHAWLDGGLPSGFGRLSSLKRLYIDASNAPGSWEHQLSGPIPEELYDCPLEDLTIINTHISGGLSSGIGKLTNLHDLRLANNNLSGPLPANLASLPLERSALNLPLELSNNNFTGKIPETFKNWPMWDLCWGYIIPGNELDYSECPPHVPAFTVSTIDGGRFNSSSVRDNKLTVFFQWVSWCPYSPEVITTLKSLYDDYHGKGLEVVNWSYENLDQIRSYVAGQGIPGVCFMNESRGGANTIGIQMWPEMSTPDLVVFDSNAEMVYHSFGVSDDFAPFVRAWFGDGPDPTYESSDYSADGTVHVLQTASEGAGIDVVLMGDAYSDRLIADGTYAEVMNSAMEAFFAEDPYRSYRNLFNVSYVDVVSKNEHYQGQTALKTWYGEGTAVGGDDAKVLQYAKKVLDPAGRSTDELLVVVLMNRDYRAGTCYMTGRPEGDYGCGYGIAYVPVHSDKEEFGTTVRHEAGGHGFAKLADEYSYGGTIPQEELESYRGVAVYGWWRNVDFTSDPTAVKWADFISDSRYSGEGIGVFEGACTYSYGAYRPTENSIMLNSNWGFNAPSRYAIWYRINKLAYGSSWTGTREDFVAWDKAHPNPAHAPKRLSKASAAKGAAPLPPLGKPVFRFER